MRDTTSTLDICSTIFTLEICEGNARLFGKTFISIKIIFHLACHCNLVKLLHWKIIYSNSVSGLCSSAESVLVNTALLFKAKSSKFYCVSLFNFKANVSSIRKGIGRRIPELLQRSLRTNSSQRNGTR